MVLVFLCIYAIRMCARAKKRGPRKIFYCKTVKTVPYGEVISSL